MNSRSLLCYVLFVVAGFGGGRSAPPGAVHAVQAVLTGLTTQGPKPLALDYSGGKGFLVRFRFAPLGEGADSERLSLMVFGAHGDAILYEVNLHHEPKLEKIFVVDVTTLVKKDSRWQVTETHGGTVDLRAEARVAAALLPARAIRIKALSAMPPGIEFHPF